MMDVSGSDINELYQLSGSCHLSGHNLKANTSNTSQANDISQHTTTDFNLGALKAQRVEPTTIQKHKWTSVQMSIKDWPVIQHIKH